MAVITKRYLSEMVASIVSGGDVSQSKKFPTQVIEAFLQEEINKRLRAEYFQVTLPSGETIPDGMSLVSYDGIAVEKYKNVSRVKLPFMPVSLPRNMGVFFVGPSVGQAGGSSPVATSDAYFIAEGVVGGSIRVVGTDNEVAGITSGSSIVTCNSFSGKYVNVVRGSLPVPGIDTGDGGLFYTKVKDNNYITFNQPFSDGDYVKIEAFIPIVPANPDYVIVESRVGVNVVLSGNQSPVTGISVGSTNVTCATFAGKLVNVTRGSLLLPGSDPGNGGLFYTKDQLSNTILFNSPLQADEYLKIQTL